ncbi:DUF2892 domain-containing protein [Pontibacillus sp. HMF3514]|nr:DUF2892 domain-containing protein [Pontibacillus sp. HMF3514]QHE50972.1 DUF2892 domain-containing protein [Pontibacillus sp. HMF3514]
MMVRPNIGIINAMIRITVGLTVVAYSTARMVRQPWRQSSMMYVMIGAMKVAEGIVRYCPVTAMVQQQVDQKKEKDDEESGINPS